MKCGITHTTGRIEWICVAPIHDTSEARSERHYYVRRWPPLTHTTDTNQEQDPS